MIHSILLEQNYQGRFYFGNHKTIISTCTVVVVLVKANLLVILKSEIGKFGLIHFCFKARLTSSIYPYFFSFPCNPFFHVPLIFYFCQEDLSFFDRILLTEQLVHYSLIDHWLRDTCSIIIPTAIPFNSIQNDHTRWTTSRNRRLHRPRRRNPAARSKRPNS